jgi:hypothetical protein
MAVPEDALAGVERFCEERTPPDLHEQMRLALLRARQRDHRRATCAVEPGAARRMDDVAQLRHDPATRHGRSTGAAATTAGIPTNHVKPPSDIRRLLAEIDADPTGIFWG